MLFFLSLFLSLSHTHSFSIYCRFNKFAFMCTSVQPRYNTAVLLVQIFQLFASLGVEISFHCLASTLLFAWHITVEKKKTWFLSFSFDLGNVYNVQHTTMVVFHCSRFRFQLSRVFFKFNHVFCVWNALNSIDFIKNVAKSSFQLMRKISLNFNWNVNAPFASFLVWKTART